MYLVYNTVVRLCKFFCCGFLVLRTYSVYNTVVGLCQFFCCGGKVNFVWIPYIHDSFSKISRTFFVNKMIPCKTYVREDQLFLALYGSTTIQSRLFLKNIEYFVWFPKQCLLGFFILEKQLANISDGVPCCSVTLFYSTLFCCGGKANLVRFTLIYSTLLTLTDRISDRGTNTLASRGLEERFFQLCCCVSFWFWREIGFGCTYYYVFRVPYSCGVVLVLLVLAGNSFCC